ncbi:hypothetical protein C8J56DRAFT_881644 [Mycena floridula]|nr:hypothetical protein C8J56DRAFT_881644 [Mycena floridula]
MKVPVPIMHWRLTFESCWQMWPQSQCIKQSQLQLLQSWRDEDEILLVLRHPMDGGQAWRETINRLLAPKFTFASPEELPVAIVKFEAGTEDYTGHQMKLDFVTCAYNSYNNILTIHPMGMGLYEHILPAWELFGQAGPEEQIGQGSRFVAFDFWEMISRLSKGAFTIADANGNRALKRGVVDAKGQSTQSS